MLITFFKYLCITCCISALSIVGFSIAKRKLHSGHFLECYSQEGEDMVIRRLVGKKKEGFFVDVGAYHPIKLSNTYHFYRRGWRGINIDARPGSMQLFRKLRPEDTNIEVAIGNQEGTVNFYMYEESAFNTCKPPQTDGHVKVQEIPIRPLHAVLKEHVPRDQQIDFFSIDVEGLDLEVLKSNDWEAFSPNFILVESLATHSVEEALRSELTYFLKEKNYLLVAKTKNTLCFQKETLSDPNPKEIVNLSH
jgi:FkbM family methyltransferase